MYAYVGNNSVMYMDPWGLWGDSNPTSESPAGRFFTWLRETQSTWASAVVGLYMPRPPSEGVIRAGEFIHRDIRDALNRDSTMPGSFPETGPRDCPDDGWFEYPYPQSMLHGPPWEAMTGNNSNRKFGGTGVNRGREAVYDEFGNLVLDQYRGTYNYGDDTVSHFILDMIPHFYCGTEPKM